MTTTLPRPITDFDPIPFRRLLRVEWGKATDTRAARWLLALTGLLTVAIMLAPMLAPSSIEQAHSSYLGIAAGGLGFLLPVVSILTLTSEWSQRTVLTTFTQEPRRVRVIGAKITVSLVLSGIAALFGAAVTAGAVGVVTASGRAIEADLNVGVVIGYVLLIVLTVFMGVALGALLHNSAAAIAASFVLPTAFVMLGRASKPIAEWLDVSTTFNEWVLNGEWSGHTAQILVGIMLWVVVPLVAGLIRTVRREIA
jgi:ABC-2 type transport system permease protein